MMVWFDRLCVLYSDEFVFGAGRLYFDFAYLISC